MVSVHLLCQVETAAPVSLCGGRSASRSRVFIMTAWHFLYGKKEKNYIQIRCNLCNRNVALCQALVLLCTAVSIFLDILCGEESKGSAMRRGRLSLPRGGAARAAEEKDRQGDNTKLQQQKQHQQPQHQHQQQQRNDEEDLGHIVSGT